MVDEAAPDVLIIGGGVAGLWCLNRLVNRGLDAVLVEKRELGGGQTLLSQGIIHGGAKYTLQGALSGAANAIADMPERWRNCLDGTGELDLSATQILSRAHYFWTAGRLSQRMTAFFASKAMHGRTQSLPRDQWPDLFRDPGFDGGVYRLDELVLDVPSLLRNLFQPVAERVFRLDAAQNISVRTNANEGDRLRLDLPGHNLTLRPRYVLVTAGEGYPALAQRFGLNQPRMQLRPLHMVMVAHDQAPQLFGHCIGRSSTPLLTVTTHPNQEASANSSRSTWYLGGGLAEGGNDLSSPDQIERAQQLLADLLPWVNLKRPVWRAVRVNRAEPRQPRLARPDRAFVEIQGRVLVAWPTKLALTPDLCDQVLDKIGNGKEVRSGQAAEIMASRLPRATFGTTAWEAL